MSVSDAELVDRFEALYPGAITDSMDKLGYSDQTLPSRINPLTYEMRAAGIAYPARGHPDADADYDDNIRRFLRMLGDAPDHSFIAYETNDEETAHLGELSASALQGQGCRGAVIDGGVRDVRYILDKGFPTFTAYRSPADAPPRWRLEEWDVPISIGGVDIHPGDILAGDADGVVSVPRDIAIDVLEHAESIVDTENKVREEVLDGADPLESYEKHGKF